jgi:UDP-N-acetyl-alpha-D-muramoyl-L-alanyl-L-glutamate epimerase
MTQTHDDTFTIERPQFNGSLATLRYRLGELTFTETLRLDIAAIAPATSKMGKMLDLTALVLGVSYFKLRAPHIISAPDIPLTAAERAFILDVYENGLGEFYARNGLHRFGTLSIEAPEEAPAGPANDRLRNRTLVPVGGGKDSLVTVQLLEAAGVEFSPFAVNPKGPIESSISVMLPALANPRAADGGLTREATDILIHRPPVMVKRSLDPDMIRLSGEPGYYNGHVPSTAIISMIAAFCAMQLGYARIVLSNERSASEGNAEFDGRVVNHQYSKSIEFERLLANVLRDSSGGLLEYFSLLRPYSEARIAKLFARETRFDHVFSSCNRNFTQKPHEGPLWCGECPKCHFVFLIFAPVMEKERLVGIFGQNLLEKPEHEASFRNLTGLAGQKPWECVGEILEAAACLYALTKRPEWRESAIVSVLKGDLLNQYGSATLESALEELMVDSTEHLIPADVADRVKPHAL